MHLQGSTQGWLEAAKKLPADFNIKAVMQPNLIRDARAVNPRLPRGTLRHWGPGQHHTGTWEERKQRARAYFATFVDGTFRTQYAQHIGVVQFYNEIWANSQSPEERASWTEQERAAAVVWNEEYRSQPDYAHIRLALSSAAVGNDLPKAVAELAIAEDCYLAYHPYIAVYKPNALANASAVHDFPQHRAQFHHHQPEHAPDTSLYQIDAGASLLAMATTAVAPGERSEGDWRWASGRWHFMEQQWGLKPRWLFTEGGPCRDVSGSLRLDPLGGWRAIWGNDGADSMLACLSEWFDDVRGTPAFAERRIGGVHFFTTPGQSPWGTFAYEMPELARVAELIAVKWQPVAPPPPPPPPPEPEPEHDGSVARVSYKRNYVAIPPDMDVENAVQIFRQEWATNKRTVGSSYDDAGIGCGLAERRVRLYDIPAGDRQGFVDFYDTYYPGTVVEFATIAALFVADRWDAPVGTKEERAGAEMPPGDWAVSVGFNQRYQIVEGGAFHRHTGWDLNNQSPVWDSDRNMPVRACANGRVIHLVQFPDSSSWGKVCVVEHVLPGGQVVHSRHAHLREFAEGLTVGQWVKRGALLGTVGRTNVPNGAYHHHWDICISGVLVDDPGHWCFDDATCVSQHYVNPGLWVQARR